MYPMKWHCYILWGIVFLMCGCSVKRNNFFSRNYHQLTTRYNVYFNGNQALKSGVKTMENKHEEDYTNLLPVFVSNIQRTRSLCTSDMDYAAEKAAKAIDKHSITVKPRRRKNKNSKNYQTFRKKKEFNNQLDKCYLLLGKAYFYKQKYGMANNTFRFILRQYAEDEKLVAQTNLWMFRSLTEMGRYDEAAKIMEQLEGARLNKEEKEMLAAARTDFYIRQEMYPQAIQEAEKLVNVCKNMKRKPRYNFILSQLCLKEQRDAQAMQALKKAVHFNFNYEMVFNAKINMALAYQEGDAALDKKLNKMLRDAKNIDFQDRIYYALANIEERRGNEEKAVDLYWKSIHSSVNNENQQALSFRKLGDHYYKEKDYVRAQSCYDSCFFVMDSRYEDYNRLKTLMTNLTDLVACLRTIQLQDSLLSLGALSETDRNRLIDEKIQEIKVSEEVAKEQTKKEQAERNFYERNNMLSRGTSFTQTSSAGGDWYFYNPVTVSLGKNDFKRKWGRRKLEDNWRRQNKAIVDFAEEHQELVQEYSGDVQTQDTKSREYYLRDIPVTEEAREEAVKKIENAYYRAGELYLYTFDDPAKAQECFDAYIQRFGTDNNNTPMVYYLAHKAAEKAGNSEDATRYKNELEARYPKSDFTLGLENPEYFEKIGNIQKIVEERYNQAYELYRKVYYKEAEQICDEILTQYPDNKLTSQILLLKAMCVVNTATPQEGKEALEKASEASSSQEVRKMIGKILTSLTVGAVPVQYTPEEMAEARNLRANRHWVFDEEIVMKNTDDTRVSYQLNKEVPHVVIILLPKDFNLVEETRFKARLTFINASELVEGNKYEMKKENLWYKQEGLVIKEFKTGGEAVKYMRHMSSDKHLLKILADHTFRMFAINQENLEQLKRTKNLDDYLDFFVDKYFDYQQRGEVIVGKWGVAGHVFTYEDNANHHFVLALPFRKLNTNRFGEMIHAIDPAFSISRMEYDNELELIVVKNIGTKQAALDFMNAVLKNRDIYDRLIGINHETFVITEENLKEMTENHYLEQYMRYFVNNYTKAIGLVGVEDGDYVYNKNVHRHFVILYPNSIDPFKLKEAFEEFNFAGLSIRNKQFDKERDCMIISDFKNKEEGMRYFKTVMNNRKLFKILRSTEYVNFIITEANLQTLFEKQDIEAYLEFFRKYYLN